MTPTPAATSVSLELVLDELLYSCCVRNRRGWVLLQTAQIHALLHPDVARVAPASAKGVLDDPVVQTCRAGLRFDVHLVIIVSFHGGDILRTVSNNCNEVANTCTTVRVFEGKNGVRQARAAVEEGKVDGCCEASCHRPVLVDGLLHGSDIPERQRPARRNGVRLGDRAVVIRGFAVCPGDASVRILRVVDNTMPFDVIEGCWTPATMAAEGEDGCTAVHVPVRAVDEILRGKPSGDAGVDEGTVASVGEGLVPDDFCCCCCGEGPAAPAGTLRANGCCEHTEIRTS